MLNEKMQMLVDTKYFVDWDETEANSVQISRRLTKFHINRFHDWIHTERIKIRGDETLI